MIAIFYHVYMHGGEIPVNFDNALRIAAHQIDNMNCAGLLKEAGHLTCGVNGRPEDVVAVAAMWEPEVEIVHNLVGVAELPTMKLMQDWCKTHPDALVLYLHTKGAIHNSNPVYERWRHCMERVVIGRWRECVADLRKGFDSAGAHWLTPEAMPFIGKTAYWGGNFWWATAKFINTLPRINVSANRYEAEVWIGRGPRRPKVHDYAPHFPMSGC